MNEKRFLELFPEIDDNGIWKKEEKSQKKMEEDKQKNQKQREEFFAHIKVQIQPKEPWELPRNRKLLESKNISGKNLNFGITRKIMIYTATAAAFLILVIVLPNLSDFLKMSGQQEQEVLRQNTDHIEQEIIADNPIDTTESMDISNQKTEDKKESKETKEKQKEKNNNKIKVKDKQKEEEQNSSGFYSDKKDSNNITNQETIVKQETKRDKNKDQKEKNTDKLNSDLKVTDDKEKDELNNNHTEPNSFTPESALEEEQSSSLPEFVTEEDMDVPFVESSEENSVPAAGANVSEENSVPTTGITSSTAEDNQNIENEIIVSAGNIVADSTPESFPANIMIEESSEITVDTSAISTSSAFEYALMKGEGKEVILEGEEELSKIEIEQKLKEYPYFYYEGIWYQAGQETIEAVNKEELLGTAFILKEKMAADIGLEVSIYGDREDLSFVFVRFFAEGTDWYYSYKKYQE